MTDSHEKEAMGVIYNKIQAINYNLPIWRNIMWQLKWWWQRLLWWGKMLTYEVGNAGYEII